VAYVSVDHDINIVLLLFASMSIIIYLYIQMYVSYNNYTLCLLKTNNDNNSKKYIRVTR